MVVSKRVYEPYASSDGYRVLVDRIWPRGVSKDRAHVDLWAKDVAPSRELREWYRHDPAKWPEFQKRYKEELKAPEAKAVLDDIAGRAQEGQVTLVYASQASEMCNATVLEALLNRRLKVEKSTKG